MISRTSILRAIFFSEKNLTNLTIPFLFFVFLMSGFCEFAKAEQPSVSETNPALCSPCIYRADEIPAPYADENRQFQGIASLETVSNERLWASWYGCGKDEGKDNAVFLATSGDSGETWKIVLVVDPDGAGPVRAFDSTLWLAPDGALWFFWTQAETKSDARKGVWGMRTENPQAGKDAVWSDPVRLCDGVMMNKPIALKDGRWLYPAAVWQIDGDKVHLAMKDLEGANVYLGGDSGRELTFFGQARVPKPDALFDEHCLVESSDGSLRMYIRTRYGIGESISRDGGRHWSAVVPSRLAHTSSRFFIRRLASGALLLVKNGPLDLDVGRTFLTAFISDDDGKTWQGGLVLDPRGEISYPDGGQAPDGTIYIIYDRNRQTDREIWLARFTEEDVRAARLDSAVGRRQILINKAMGDMKATVPEVPASLRNGSEGEQ